MLPELCPRLVRRGDRCPCFVAAACGLGAEPGGPFSAWCLGSLASSLAQGRGKLAVGVALHL